MTKQTYDPEKFQLPFARLKKGGHIFELAIDQDKALDFRQGKVVPVLDILHYEKVFADVQKGQLAPEETVKATFNTTELEKVAEIILAQGEVHYTAKFRQELRDAKRNAIVNRIHKFGVDPRTQAPHPIQRIENALGEAKVHIDEHSSVEDQTKVILKKLQPLLPISFQEFLCEVRIPAEHSHKMYSKLRSMGTINKEDWQSDGSLHVLMRIPAGLFSEVVDQANSLTHGQIHIEKIDKEKIE